MTYEGTANLKPSLLLQGVVARGHHTATVVCGDHSLGCHNLHTIGSSAARRNWLHAGQASSSLHWWLPTPATRVSLQRSNLLFSLAVERHTAVYVSQVRVEGNVPPTHPPSFTTGGFLIPDGKTETINLHDEHVDRLFVKASVLSVSVPQN